MTRVRHFDSGTVIAAFGGLWLLVIISALVAKSLRVESDVWFYLICFFSGTLAGSFVRAGSRHIPGTGTWLMLIFAGLGLSRYFRGDPSGLLVALMFGGCAVGSLIITLLPKEPEPEDEPVESSWDED